MSRLRKAGLTVVRSRLVCAVLGKPCIYCRSKTLATMGWGSVLSGLHVPLCHRCRVTEAVLGS